MISSLIEVSTDPYAQAFAIFVATLILEDLAIIGAGILVANGTLPVAPTFISLIVGLAAGDLGLYLIGRSRLARWGASRLTSPARLAVALSTLRNNLIRVLIVARCVPGLRLPTFLAAGIARADVIRFTLLILLLAIVWVALLLPVSVQLGTYAERHLGSFRYLVLAGVVVGWVWFSRSTGNGISDSLSK
jgi:membrane protein DedA with SNARE-associated domain